MATTSEQSRKKRERLRQQHESHLKQIMIEKEFRASLLRVLKVLGLADLYLKLPQRVHDLLLFTRMRSVRLELADETKISRRLLDRIRKTLALFLVNFKTSLFAGSEQVTLEDFCTAGMTLYFFALSGPREKSSPGEVQFKKNLYPLVKSFMQPDSIPLKQLETISLSIASMFSSPNLSLYHFNTDMYSEGSGLKLKMSLSVKLHRTKAITKNFVIDGKPRPAYRIGSPYIVNMWLTIPLSKLGLSTSSEYAVMQAFIQSHALIRMRERLNTIYQSEVYLMLVIALESFENIIRYKKRLLIPFSVWNSKIGYFLMEIVQDFALIKTFLFITNSGTPEGDLLDKELNASKIEKEFLEIDRLSAYVNTDLPNDPRIRKIYERAGLEYLCNLDRAKFTMSKSIKSGYAADFIKYMNLERTAW